MISDGLKIARLNARVSRDAAVVDLAKTLLYNPVVELIAGVSILEYQSRHGHIGNAVNVASLAALYGIIGVQMLSPVLPLITESSKDLIGGVTKALPALAVL